MEQTLTYIGNVRSPLKTIDDCPLQESENAPNAELLIFPQFREAIKNITPGSQLILLTWFHKADRSVVKCYPRRDVNAAHIGVFSTRSPDRPNPIGMHTVKVISINDSTITVEALEALDGTPLLDIKPVLKPNNT